MIRALVLGPLAASAALGAALAVPQAPPASPAASETPSPPPPAERPQDPPSKPAPFGPEEPVWKRLPKVSVADAVTGAIGWLVQNQNTDGSWGSHHSPRPIEVLASVPGSQYAFREATTALCIMALRDAGPRGKGVDQAVDRGLAFLLENYDVKRQSGMEHYNVWPFGFALQCFGEELARNPEGPRAKELRAASAKLVERLGQYQTLDGGWGYLSLDAVPTMQPSDTSMSFTTATILLGAQRGRGVGIELPAKMIERAVDHVRRSRLSDDAFLYGEYLKYRPRHGVNELAGSACRTPVCLLVLEMFGEKVSAATYEKSIENLLVKYADYQKAGVRRPIPHESWFSVSGYFFLYGHAYAAYVIEKLPPAAQKKYWPLLDDAVQYCREPDGSFWDYPLYSYHKPYGTAFALLALARAQRYGLK